MKILLTGGSGFVGGAIEKKLLAADLELIRLDRCRLNTPTSEENIIFTDSIFDKSKSWWSDILRNIDVVIHCAWYVDPKDYLHSAENISCLNGTMTLAQACVESNVKHFIGLGTCFEYGEDTSPVTIDTPLNPTTTYAVSKALAYYCLKDIFLNSSTDFSWYRLFNLYGETEKSGRFGSYLTEQFKKNMPAKINQPNLERDYMHVNDAAELIAKSFMSGQKGVFNVCSGKPISLRKLSTRLAEEHNAIHLLEFSENNNENRNILKSFYGICNIRG